MPFTILDKAEKIEFKEKNSKFSGFLFPIANEASVKLQINHLKAAIPEANHFCYAFILSNIGGENLYRYSDDGEPAGSAGLPIYGQLLAADLINVLCVVVRVFGGVKLGKSGLIGAYKLCANQTVNSINKIPFERKIQYSLSFKFSEEARAYRILKQLDARITNKTVAERLQVEFEIAETSWEDLKKATENFAHLMTLTKIN